MKNFLILGTILVIIFIVFSMAVNTSEAPLVQMAPEAPDNTVIVETEPTTTEEIITENSTDESI